MTGAHRAVVFSIGANLGDRHAALQGAVDLLSASLLVHDAEVSPVYSTAPVGGPADQPSYLNAVLRCRSGAAPIELLGLAYAAEQAFGRTREVRWGARTLDVDLLMVGELVSADPTLTLPHPRAHERAFVLVPWDDVDPHAQLPGHGAVADLRRAAVTAAGVDAIQPSPEPLQVRR
jgi:2-amino-4-hydroxy-6-hydroxymethyldihydropteridine diphosphokinase